MATNLIHYEYEGRARWGVIDGGTITPIAGAFATTGEVLAAQRALELTTIREAAVKLLSPVTRNQQFICQGANYRQHMIESGMDPDAKKFNMIFTKAASCIAPANSDLVKPRIVNFLDYEIELGLIIRRDITAPVTVTDDTLHEFVAGIVIVNDYSARDVQIPQSQFYKGKSFRTFGPIGPYLCLLEPDDMRSLKNLDLRLTVNGKPRQADTTANLVFGPAETLTELSRVQDLFAGDLISTGTPAGCALAIPSPRKQRIGAALFSEAKRWKVFLGMQAKRPGYLVHGDIVEARISSPDGRIDLGTQRNQVVAE